MSEIVADLLLYIIPYKLNYLLVCKKWNHILTKRKKNAISVIKEKLFPFMLYYSRPLKTVRLARQMFQTPEWLMLEQMLIMQFANVDTDVYFEEETLLKILFWHMYGTKPTENISLPKYKTINRFMTLRINRDLRSISNNY